MKTTQKLHELGQSLWIDNITRDLLNSGLLKHSIDEWSVTGLISNPTAFGHAIKNSTAYDATIRKSLKIDMSGKKLFFELALEDLRHAADLFRPIYDQTDGVDGWVSIEVSPLLIHDTTDTLTTAKDLYRRARRPNIFIAIPGTKKNLPVVEEAIFAGVPVNVTLLFSREHYLAAAEAFLRGIERRITAGLRPDIRVDDLAHLQNVTGDVDDIDPFETRRVGQRLRGIADAEADQQRTLGPRMKSHRQVDELLHVAACPDIGRRHPETARHQPIRDRHSV